ncbi:sensor histidine kinase [Dyadobacter arcticus]|uniref:Sensor histidine kinase YesM n=1 Tax=Dyadobacter arcticus TaxID=1078754 RepID=A0ABX0ULC5_9BACT|nr:histidine kinase [Dyadobacter arcticus]NIJ53798.1 sensor histidine kinase YesM [Dyadobacter arcticus]
MFKTKWPHNQLTLSVLFWTFYFMYEWLSVPAMTSEYVRYFINACVIVPATWLGAYLTVHVFFKAFYLKDKRELFWAFTIATMVIVILGRRYFNYYYTYPLYYPEGNRMPFFALPKLIIEFVNMYLIVALYSLFFFFRTYYEQQKLTQALQKDKIQSELELLKLQVHPHFIFNTLNNIYSFSIQQDPRTPDLIHRLSSFLDHNLYEVKSQVVSLDKEVEYIQNYIELEKIRFGDRLDISLNILSKIDQFYISPMLLLPLVENAFKHGAGKVNDHSWIRIDFSIRNETLTVKIENSCPLQAVDIQPGRYGIGIENVKRRLEILYPGKHEFNVLSEINTFMVILKIQNGASA